MQAREVLQLWRDRLEPGERRLGFGARGSGCEVWGAAAAGTTAAAPSTTLSPYLSFTPLSPLSLFSLSICLLSSPTVDALLCGAWCGLWGVWCGVWSVGCGVWSVGCGVWDVGCEVWSVGCGMGDFVLGS